RCHSLTVGHPDVLDLRRLAQILPPLAVFGIEKIAKFPARPGALHVARRRELDRLDALAIPEIPHALDIVVLGENLPERVLVAGDDVDHARRYVGRLEHAIEIRSG